MFVNLSALSLQLCLSSIDPMSAFGHMDCTKGFGNTCRMNR